MDVEVKHPTKCPSCEGTGKVYYQAGIDDDNYPLYKRMVCPYCHGAGVVDLCELFVVPRAFVKSEFFVDAEFTAESQDRLRRALRREQDFFDNIL
jgi:RecJ-like exonuclease